MVCPNRNRHCVAEAAAANVLKLRTKHKSKVRGGADRGNKTYQGKSPAWDCSSNEQKISYISSLSIVKQGNMDKFRENPG